MLDVHGQLITAGKMEETLERAKSAEEELRQTGRDMTDWSIQAQSDSENRAHAIVTLMEEVRSAILCRYVFAVQERETRVDELGWELKLGDINNQSTLDALTVRDTIDKRVLARFLNLERGTAESITARDNTFYTIEPLAFLDQPSHDDVAIFQICRVPRPAAQR